jgi:hypothetical protein
MFWPLISEYGGVACNERVNDDPLSGYIRLGPVENLVSFVVRLNRFDVPLSKRNE